MKIGKKQIILLIFLFFLAVGIFYFSSQNGEKSGGFSENLTEKILQIFEITNVDEENAERFLRKTAHFVEFYILGGLLCLIFLSFRRSMRMSGGLSFGIAFLYACIDEFHQFFVPERAASFFDVLLDSTGAFFGILTVLGVCFFRSKKKS